MEHLQVRLLTSPKDRTRCDDLLIEHHYLHDATLVGEQLRYVATYKGHWLALASWSGAAFHLKDRDEFLARSVEQCRRRRLLLANNSRLLVLPECHSANLISRFMKLMLGRLSQDWQQRLTGPIQDSLVIVDGKKMRHGGVEMVNVTNGRGQYLGGVITQAKSNEIPAARQLLRRLDLAGKILLSLKKHSEPTPPPISEEIVEIPA